MAPINPVSVFNGTQFLANHSLNIQQDKIGDIQPSNGLDSSDYLVPGLIDLQILGASGKLFSAEPSEESISIIEQTLLKQGTTGFLICLPTNSDSVFKDCIQVIKNHRPYAKNCLGLHLEGPYISPKKPGAHLQQYIKKASLEEIKKLLDFADGTVKMMTLAPELQDDAVLQYLLDNQVIVSLGHSDATFEQATAAYEKGVQTTTHLFNAMSPLLHRQPGIPAAVFNHAKAQASIVADGIHVNFEVIKMAKKLMKERLFLISDAVTECHQGPYKFHKADGRFTLPDGTLSGSAISLLDAVKNCVSHCDISLEEALRMASAYPAKLINQHHLFGQIAVGKQANFLLLDKDLNLKQVFYKGQQI